MKNSIRLDVVSANDMLLDKKSKQNKSTGPVRKSANRGDAKNIVNSLGSPWKESTWGAEIKANTQDASAKANIYKKSDDTYNVRLSIDVTSLSSLQENSPEDCIKNLLTGIESVADVCSQLSRDLAQQQTEQTTFNEVSEVVQTEDA
tara:strand:+ start:34601 stop:35041 length:441 start_codon:yes stop_codon:yes gene_type:complete